MTLLLWLWPPVTSSQITNNYQSFSHPSLIYYLAFNIGYFACRLHILHLFHKGNKKFHRLLLTTLCYHAAHSIHVAEEHINYMLNMQSWNNGFEELQGPTFQDPILQKVLPLNATTGQNYQKLIHFQIWNNLIVKSNLPLKNQNIVISAVMPSWNPNYQRIDKNKSLLREKVWWPIINHHFEQFIAARHSCQVNAALHIKSLQTKMTPLPKCTFEKLPVDIKVPLQTHESCFVLITCDSLSSSCYHHKHLIAL